MKYSTIIPAIRQRFLDTVKESDGFNYDLDRCEVVAWPSSDLLDPLAGSTLYMIVPDRETTTENLSYALVKVANVDLVLARRLEFEGTQWQTETEYDMRDIAQNKLADDLEAALAGWDYTAYAENIEVQEIDRAADRTYVEGWAIVFATLRIQWEQQAS